MKNVDIQVKNNVAVIKVDLTKNFGVSGSGKSTIIASSSGNVVIPGTDAKLGINVYKPVE